MGLMRLLFGLWVVVFSSFAGSSIAGSLSPFVFVMIDSKTEGIHGGLPFNRALMAKAVDRLAAAKAKGIVLKFFYDLPSTEDRDSALESSICGSPVALQACLNDSEEATTNSIAVKFQVEGAPLQEIPLFGDTGFIPLRRFSKCAHGIGFVDHF